MHFINKNLNTEITIVEENDQLLFDMEEVAKGLGIKSPKDSLRLYMDRNPKVKTRRIVVGGRTYFNEGDMYLYTLRSKSEKAEEFQEWVAQEVLPTVRKVGLQAIKELEVLQFIAQQPRNSGLTREGLPHEVSDEFLLSNGLHWLTEYSAPSAFNVPLTEFYKAATELGYIDEEGELLKPETAVHNPKYHNCYTPSGKWYAWSPQDGAAIALRAKSAQPVAVPSARDLELL